MTRQIGNALDLLRGHGGDNRETKSQWGTLTLAPAKLKLIATFIEQRGIKDGLELVGHDGKRLSIHPTLLGLVTEVDDLDGSYLKSPVFQHITQSKASPNFLSTYVCGIITPIGLPHVETVEELPVKDTRTKKFRLKVIPKQHKTEYFDAIFVFDGEKAPSMSIVSLSKEVSIVAYREWKTVLKGGGFLVLILAFSIIATILADRWNRPRLIGRFSQHATELQKSGELKSADKQAIGDAITIYTSFIRPKPKKIWSKIFLRFDHF